MDTTLAPESTRWHLRAVRLPYGEHPEDWWIVDGHLTDQPVPNAVELPGGWVVPGLVDAHAHLTMDFNRTGLTGDALIAANRTALLQGGVLAVRDAGILPTATIAQLRADQPRVITSSQIFALPGHFHEGIYVPTTPDRLVASALAAIAEGTTWVKFIADFPGPDWNWWDPIVHYPVEVVRELVQAVHGAGGRVLAHTSGPFVSELVRAGVDSIEHGNFVTPEVAREMAERGTAWTTTIATVRSYVEPMAEMPGPIGDLIRANYARWREALPVAVQLGVPVMAGSDEIPAGNLHQEIASLQDFGLTPADALAAASTTARAYLGLPDFAPGAPADLVLYDRDPRQDLTALTRPTAIVLAGERVGVLEGVGR